jgi:hypothetical protein
MKNLSLKHVFLEVPYIVGPRNMAKSIQVGDRVFVPVERVSAGDKPPFPVVEGEVKARADRTLTVDLPYDIGLVQVASSAVYEADLSVSVVRLGDFATEETLLNPITKSLSHYLRLLLPDDRLRTHYVRSDAEFYELYANHSQGVSHFVLVGHVSGADLLFAMDRRVSSSEFATEVSKATHKASDFLLLCCESGKKGFARPFSKSACCNNLIAPMGKLHGASAAQFATTLFAHMLLEGDSIRVAYKAAAGSTPGGPNFRHWVAGQHHKR